MSIPELLTASVNYCVQFLKDVKSTPCISRKHRPEIVDCTNLIQTHTTSGKQAILKSALKLFCSKSIITFTKIHFIKMQ